MPVPVTGTNVLRLFNTTELFVFAVVEGTVRTQGFGFQDVSPELADGHQVLRIAQKAVPSIIRTVVDMDTVALALAKIIDYRKAKGTAMDYENQDNLIWAHPNGAPERAFAVLDVQAGYAHAQGVIGGLTNGPIIVRAAWSLLYLPSEV